ncbi:sugar ABC transporter ATP-binding protein [Paenibacillus sp. Soil750]|uniref:sugar ABC transporter ATP-binding protein n=1 Tax=Paenibacillus sp. Soil750 TaxID=1736398 RepID=UPI0006F68E65|nr:sugar ABC transporter ATP-binding protein [Paenibacillus sp. Soil750]KRE69640.1 hypothetical protein ASL11_14775 [Paenibacillus sp. Soil750]
MAATLLKMSKIKKRFYETVALAEVDLEIKKGEVHILLGENGAGKSTLMKILSGSYVPDEGEIYWEGRPAAIKCPADSLSLGIGMVYQELTMIKELSVMENIFLGRMPKRKALPFVDWKQVIENTGKVLSTLGLEIDVHEKISQFDLGIQQLVEIARAISRDAKLIILDEPTSALTDKEVRSLFSAIKRLKNQGISFVYITHKLDEVFEIGDTVTVLRDGHSIDTINDISSVTQDLLVCMMVGRSIDEQYPKMNHCTSKEVLKISGLGDGKAIKDISFTLHEGEILGIAGLVGSGITELLETLFGLRKAAEGSIQLNGETYSPLSPKSAIDRKLGFVTKNRKEGLLLHMSVAENITVSSSIGFSRWGVRNKKKEFGVSEDYRKLLKISTPSVSNPIGKLSGGNQQKGAIAKWLCNQTKIFIMDDPTRGIDIGAKVEVYKLLNQITEQGGSILLVSTELPELIGLSDNIVVMNRGRLVASFDARECSQELIMEKAAGGL